MKKTIFIMIVLCSAYNSANSQSGWFSQESGTHARINSVFFTNASMGWAAGEEKIFKTVNGGLNWLLQEYFTQENYYYKFNSVFFTNSSTGYIAGDLTINPWGSHYGVIIRTTNSGENWMQQNFSGTENIKSIYFANSMTGWAAGGSIILKTTSGGLSWIPQQFFIGENDSYSLNSVYFTDSVTGFISGKLYVSPPGNYYGIILKTTDAGVNWVIQRLSGIDRIISICFVNSMTGWVIGGNGNFGIIQSTTNGGINWVIQSGWGSENCSVDLQSVHFVNSMTGWVSGGSFCSPYPFGFFSLISKTTNGGLNWTNQVSFEGQNNNYKLNTVFFMNSATGWSAGDGGIILKTTTGGENFIGINPASNEIPGKYILYQNYPNPFNPSTKIRFDILSPEGAAGSIVKLTVFDILGRELASLVNEPLRPGSYEVSWNASSYPSGFYFYKLEAYGFTVVKKMILIK